MSTAKRVVLALAAVRSLLGLVAIPLAPALFRDHFVVLVLLRPTKEVLLAGGFLLREGEVKLLEVVLAAIPLSILGVWLFYWLGRSFAHEIQSGKGLPKFADKLLPPKRIRALCQLLKKKGRPVVILGRLAAFPSTLLGAAAGASDVPRKEFLPADALGGALSIAEVMIAGYVLGAAYKEAGPWLSAVGAAVLVGLLVFIGRWIKKQSGSEQPREAARAEK